MKKKGASLWFLLECGLTFLSYYVGTRLVFPQEVLCFLSVFFFLDLNYKLLPTQKFLFFVSTKKKKKKSYESLACIFFVLIQQSFLL